METSLDANGSFVAGVLSRDTGGVNPSGGTSVAKHETHDGLHAQAWRAKGRSFVLV
jgi:hypothetical protein